jgi:hypothetical protein
VLQAARGSLTEPLLGLPIGESEDKFVPIPLPEKESEKEKDYIG